MQQGMPLLTYETDGYPVSPAVLRQIDVHIQQVLQHHASTGNDSEHRDQKPPGLLQSALDLLH
jgi:hypothetical protein